MFFSSFIHIQVPRYIITLHELLAHTPHNHVERKSLENAKSKLEELSKVRICVPIPPDDMPLDPSFLQTSGNAFRTINVQHVQL